MKVSVSLVTYNHENFIAQAIDSILKQDTNFDYEIVIGEDDSLDNTRNIVKTYKENHPERIKLFLNKREDVVYINGKPTGRRNFINNIKNSSGKYIALLDGDDYWTSPHKLQKQVDFLEKHPECALCFHAVEIISEIKEQKSRIARPYKKKAVYTLKDILKGNFIHTCSVMFRRGLFGEFPDWFYKTTVADWPLHILNAQYGDIGYIDEVMGVYRAHEMGIYSSKKGIDQVKGMIETYHYINKQLHYRYNRLIKFMIFFKSAEKKIGNFLSSHGLNYIVNLYRKIFYY